MNIRVRVSALALAVVSLLVLEALPAAAQVLGVRSKTAARSTAELVRASLLFFLA